MLTTIAVTKHQIEHNCDGPLTPFVLMSRACELAAKPGADHEAIANALYLALRERDWCSHSAETRAGDVVHYDAETA